jgi:hypothetical protein
MRPIINFGNSINNFVELFVLIGGQKVIERVCW